MNSLVWASLGAGVGLGLLLIMVGLASRRSRTDEAVPAPARRRRRPAWTAGSDGPMILIAVAAGVAVELVTGWPVMAVGVGAFVVWRWRRHITVAAQAAELARIDAIASWVEAVRDGIYAVEPDQALLEACSHPPPEIAEPLERFARRVTRKTMDPAAALDALRDELDSGFADQVIVAIQRIRLLGSRQARPILTRYAEVMRDQARQRRKVEVARARLRLRSTIVQGVIAATIGILLLLGRDILAGYSTPAGQVWLVVVMAVFAGALALMDRFDRFDVPERFTARRNPVVVP